MSGHNKWSTIKHKKGKADAARGKIFTKIIRLITVSAREGGGDPSSNSNLRLILEKAKVSNMPKDTIVKAIKRGTGELSGVNYEDMSYEGYGPGGAAVIVMCLSDNKNRTVSEVRHIFSKYGGSLGENGCVSWIFEKKGFFIIDGNEKTDDEMMDLVLEAGADDYSLMEETEEEKLYEVYCEANDFMVVKEELEKIIPVKDSKLTLLPKNTVKLEGKKASQMLTLMEYLEDCDDVQEVYSNFDIDDKLVEEIMNG
ncbi:YebC/PmpR family DNA-binding transcriptional regulator [bacterium]|nr:YebC/PmpR family DNA-binding transcriptional regulator [bacterium]